jgi:hypothetical protein
MLPALPPNPAFRQVAMEALGSLLRGGATVSGRKGKAEMRVVWEVCYRPSWCPD